MTELPVTDPQLIAAIADRDKHEAWQAFERVYRPALMAALRKHGLCYADAEDGCQRILLKLVRAISTFRDDGKPAAFRRWLLRIAKNESISHWRKLATQPQTLRDSSMMLHGSIELQADSLEGSIQLEYERCMFQYVAQQIKSQTDPRQWQAFWRTAVDGSPTPIVAKELGMSVGAVYVAKGRVLKSLQAAARNAENDL